MLEPLWARMNGKVLESTVIHTDDTPGKCLGPKVVTNKKRPDLDIHRRPDPALQHAVAKTRWTARVSGRPCRIPARPMPMRATTVCMDRRGPPRACWAHCRRKFFEARTTDPSRAYRILAMIRILYRIERTARKAERKTSSVRKLRQREAVPRGAEGIAEEPDYQGDWVCVAELDGVGSLYWRRPVEH